MTCAYSWTQAQKVHFADGGVFDQIFTRQELADVVAFLKAAQR